MQYINMNADGNQHMQLKIRAVTVESTKSSLKNKTILKLRQKTYSQGTYE